MLELVTILLITLPISAVSVWLYRTVSGWKGFNRAVVARRGPAVRMKLTAQQGYISLISEPKQKAKVVRLRGPKNGVKVPWGW